MTNNPALFDAVVSAAASTNQAWLTATNPSAYARQANIAAAIATEVDALIPPVQTGVTLSQRALLATSTANVLSGRQLLSILPSQYAGIAAAIVGLFAGCVVKLQDPSTGGNSGLLPSINQIVWVQQGGSETATGTYDNPFPSIGDALASIVDATPSKNYIVMVGPGSYAETIILKSNVTVCGLSNESCFATSVQNDFTASCDNAGLSNFTVGGISLNFNAAALAQATATFESVVNTANTYVTAFDDVTYALNGAIFETCYLAGNYTQQGGTVEWHNVTQPATTTLTVTADINGSTSFTAYGGSSAALITIDQNVQPNPLTFAALGFDYSQGTCTIQQATQVNPNVVTSISSAAENPIILVTPELGNLAHAPKQSRISCQLALNGDSTITVGAASNVSVTCNLPTPIRELFDIVTIDQWHMSYSMVGPNWVEAVGCAVWVHFDTIGGVPSAIVEFVNPTAAPIAIADLLTLNVYGYLPTSML